MNVFVKRLMSSDISIFEDHSSISRERSIRLPHNIFVERFYPSLKSKLKNLVLPIVIIGPKGGKPYLLTRKIQRSHTSDDWVLSGEPIYDPTDEPQRFSKVKAGDLAVIGFDGHGLPEEITCIIISQVDDLLLFENVVSTVNLPEQGTGISISAAEIEHMRNQSLSAYPLNHPFNHLIEGDGFPQFRDDQQAEPSIKNNPLDPLLPKRLYRRLQTEYERRWNSEQMLYDWLISTGHTEDQIEWTSVSHARAPYDFKVNNPGWNPNLTEAFIDVKTTSGLFERDFHASLAELRFAASSDNYKIARIYECHEQQPKFKLLDGLASIANEVLTQIQQFPKSITPDSFRISPTILNVEIESDLPPKVDDDIENQP